MIIITLIQNIITFVLGSYTSFHRHPVPSLAPSLSPFLHFYFFRLPLHIPTSLPSGGYREDHVIPTVIRYVRDIELSS